MKIMTNILTETLEEVYEDAESKMTGGYGPDLKLLISSILENCECDEPNVDIAVQMEGLIDDLGVLKTALSEAVAAKLGFKP
jgi:hypothetical protein